MLGMIESVPLDKRDDPGFGRALVLAAHLSACRENWLDRMIAEGQGQVDWWPEDVKFASLRPRYAAMESKWADYLASLTDDDLDCDFEFGTTDGKRWRWSIEGQIVQLVGHAFYHRGQIALLVGELGGEPVDTDYLYWEYQRNPRYGVISE